MGVRKINLEQYFTPECIVIKHFDWLRGHIPDLTPDRYIILDPMAGAGVYGRVMRKLGYKVLEFDAAPQSPHIQKLDFFKTMGNLDPHFQFDKPVLMITNPPYGRNNNLVKKTLHTVRSLFCIKYVSLLVAVKMPWSGNLKFVARSSGVPVTFHNFLENKPLPLTTEFILFKNQYDPQAIILRQNKNLQNLNFIKRNLASIEVSPRNARVKSAPDAARLKEFVINGLKSDPHAVTVRRSVFMHRWNKGGMDECYATAKTFREELVNTGGDFYIFKPKNDLGRLICQAAVIKEAFNIGSTGHCVHFSLYRWAKLPVVLAAIGLASERSGSS